MLLVAAFAELRAVAFPAYIRPLPMLTFSVRLHTAGIAHFRAFVAHHPEVAERILMHAFGTLIQLLLASIGLWKIWRISRASLQPYQLLAMVAPLHQLTILLPFELMLGLFAFALAASAQLRISFGFVTHRTCLVVAWLLLGCCLGLYVYIHSYFKQWP